MEEQMFFLKMKKTSSASLPASYYAHCKEIYLGQVLHSVYVSASVKERQCDAYYDSSLDS